MKTFNEFNKTLVEGKILDIEQEIKKHDAKDLSTASPADRFSHEVRRKQLLQKRSRAQREYNKKMNNESMEDLATGKGDGKELKSSPDYKRERRRLQQLMAMRRERDARVKRGYKEDDKDLDESAKWRQGYSASGHPAGFKHKNGEVGPLGGTFTTTNQYGDEKKVPVDKYRDYEDPLSDREKAGKSQSGKDLLLKNKFKNLKTLIKQSKGKHGPVGKLPESQEIDEAKLAMPLKGHTYHTKIEGGVGEGKIFGHKDTTVDDHLSAMNYHAAKYQKARDVNDTAKMEHHGRAYHNHKDQIERLGRGYGVHENVEINLDETMYGQDHSWRT